MKPLFTFNRKHGIINEELFNTGENYEILYVMSGHGLYWVEGTDIRINRGICLLLDGHKQRALKSDGSMVIYRIRFNRNWLDTLVNGIVYDGGQFKDEYETLLEMSKERVVMHFETVDRERVEWLIHDMHREIYFREGMYNAVFMSMMYVLLATIYRKIRSRSITQINRDMLELIRVRSSEKITPGQLAKEWSYNPSYFSRVFHKRFGITVTEFINTCRIDNAKQLLLNTSMSNEDIAMQVGFGDKSAFYKTFAKITGMTPKQWREKNNS